MASYIFMIGILAFAGAMAFRAWERRQYRLRLISIQQSLMEDAYGDAILVNRAIAIDQRRHGKATYESSKSVLERLQIHQ